MKKYGCSGGGRVKERPGELYVGRDGKEKQRTTGDLHTVSDSYQSQ